MLGRLARVSRCLRQAHRPLRCQKTFNCPFGTGLSPVETEKQPYPICLPKQQLLEVIEEGIGVPRGETLELANRIALSSETLGSTALPKAKPVSKGWVHRYRRSAALQRPGSTVKRHLLRAKIDTIRYRGRLQRRNLLKRRPPLSQKIVTQRARSLVSASDGHRVTPLCLSKYFDSSKEVSLGSWATLKHGEPQQLDQELAMHDSSWSKQITRLEEGWGHRAGKTSNVTYMTARYAKLLHRSWLRLPEHKWLGRWRSTMLCCMRDSPVHGLAMLLATFKGRGFKPPRYMIQDCLQVLARHYLFNVSEVDPIVKRALWRLTFNFTNGAPFGELRSYAISQEVVQLLIKNSNNTQLSLLYNRLVSVKAELHFNTLLHFLARFVDMEELQTCIEILDRIAVDSRGTRSSLSRGVVLAKKQIQAGCIKMLASHWGFKKPYPVQSKILAHMLEMGIRPSTAMYNVILLNMIKGHDFETAWQTYDIAKQSRHFATDAGTYAVLAKGAKLSGDSNILERVLRDTDEDPSMLFLNPHLMTSVLDAVSHLSPGHEFSSMLEYYKEHLDVRPLQQLGLCGPQVEAPHDTDVDKKWPDKHVLGQMILAFNKNNSCSEDLIHSFSVYIDLVNQQHPLIAPLAQDDYVANSFLMAFGKKPETLQYCTTVIKHMLSPPSSAISSPHAQPTVRTWSILLDAYMHHQQSQAAEKVLTMMRARGLQPDRITWNTLIGGYAAMQDIEGAVGTVRQMEADGFQFNAKTLRGLGRFRNRGRMLNKLRESLKGATTVIKMNVVSPEDEEPIADTGEATSSGRD